MYTPPIRVTGAPVRKPIQRARPQTGDVFSASQSLVNVVKELEDLKKKLLIKVDEAEREIERAKEIQKGDRGERGERGFTGMTGAKGEKGDSIRGEKGEKGDKGDDGKTPDKDEIARAVLAKLPFINTDKEEAEIDDTKLLEKLDKKLNIKHIDGLEQTLHALQTQTKNGYLHGGGVPSLQAGQGIILTKTSDGGYSITSTASGGGFTELPATGDIDGANVTFTFTQKPNRIISDHVWYKENLGWTWDAGTLMATMTVPPVDEIYGYL